MGSYSLLVILICLSAAFAYINHRFIKMPFVIGLFFLSSLLSLLVISSKIWGVQYYSRISILVEKTDISGLILDMMLGFLLFAGSLHTDWGNIKKELKTISALAISGVIFSTLLIGGMFYGISILLHIQLDLIYCFIFGALISPTDPIAVLGIFSKAGVPKKIESIIVGESLFNDGIGVVIFIALLDTLKLGGNEIDLKHFGELFIQEAVGGVFFGLILGFILFRLLKSIDNYEAEVLLTLAFVMGGFELCAFFHLSGALAMVIMGLFVGNYKTDNAMSDITREYVHKFWELADVILNGILFIIIAFVLIEIHFTPNYFLLSLVSILIVFLSRLLIVFVPQKLFPKRTSLIKSEAKIIVWGGLRGGLSIALVLSLPPSQSKEILMMATYVCVVFSILVQGLSIEKFAKNTLAKKAE
jgi:monovalent cation:H+ antiporter, CPA1 family